MVYLFVFILIFIGIVVYDISNHKRNKVLYFTSIFLIMSFVSGLSYRLGTDMIAYSKEYYLYKSLFDIDDVFYFFQYIIENLYGFLFLHSLGHLAYHFYFSFISGMCREFCCM